MDLKEIGCKSVDWFRMTQDGVHWRAVLNMEFIKGGEFLTSAVVISCPEGLCTLCSQSVSQLQKTLRSILLLL